MNAFAPYLMALHQQSLLDEAALSRRVRAARRGGTGIPAWRRGLGSLFASAARSIDPSLGHGRVARRAA